MFGLDVSDHHSLGLSVLENRVLAESMDVLANNVAAIGDSDERCVSTFDLVEHRASC